MHAIVSLRQCQNYIKSQGSNIRKTTSKHISQDKKKMIRSEDNTGIVLVDINIYSVCSFFINSMNISTMRVENLLYNNIEMCILNINVLIPATNAYLKATQLLMHLAENDSIRYVT